VVHVQGYARQQIRDNSGRMPLRTKYSHWCIIHHLSSTAGTAQPGPPGRPTTARLDLTLEHGNLMTQDQDSAAPQGRQVIAMRILKVPQRVASAQPDSELAPVPA
jgi:hypothetical protein